MVFLPTTACLEWPCATQTADRIYTGRGDYELWQDGHNITTNLLIHVGIGEENLLKLIQHANIQPESNIITNLQNLGCNIISGVNLLKNNELYVL